MAKFEIKDKAIKAAVVVDMSAADWQIYDDEPGAKGCAKRLNKAAAKALSLPSAEDASNFFLAAAEKESRFGASDSEPRWEFEKMAIAVYGPDNGWYS